MTANKTPRKSNSVLSVAAIAAATNPTALMKLFGFSGSVLRGDPTWGVDAPPTNWIGLTASLHARFVTLPVSFEQVAPMFQIARINDPLVVCLFMAKHTPASFTFPMDSKQSRQWVVGVFDHTHMAFQNAMFLGTFNECVTVFTQMNLSKLRSLYAQRHPLYQEVAHCQVDATSHSPQLVAEHIVRHFQQAQASL